MEAVLIFLCSLLVPAAVADGRCQVLSACKVGHGHGKRLQGPGRQPPLQSGGGWSGPWGSSSARAGRGGKGGCRGSTGRFTHLAPLSAYFQWPPQRRRRTPLTMVSIAMCEDGRASGGHACMYDGE